MTNIILNGFLHPAVGIFLGSLLIFGTEHLGRLILSKIKYSFFFVNLCIGTIVVSSVSYFFIILQLFKYTNFFLSYVLVIFGIYNVFFHLKKNYSDIIGIKVKSLIFFFIFLYFVLLFFISISAPTMADALDYHLAIPNYIYFNNKLPNQYFNNNISLLGLGEIYNYLGLIVYSDVVGPLLNLIAIFSFLNYFNKIIRDQEKYTIFVLFIVGSPILIFFISGAKFNLFPQLITTYVLFLLVQYKRIDLKKSLLIIFLLFGAMNFKLNFYLTGSALGLILLFKCKLNKKLIFYTILFFITLFIPRIIYNYIIEENFSYYNLITSANLIFLDYIRNYADSNLLFPLSLFLTDSFGKITTVLGFSILIFFFVKKISDKNILILLISTVVFILYFFYSQKTSRIFYELLLWLSLNIIFIKNYRIKIRYIKIFLFLNLIIPFTIALIGFYQLSPSIISNEYRRNVMRMNANEFKGIEWLNQIISPEATILSNIRSKALLINNNIILMDVISYDTNYYNILLNSKIDYIVVRDLNNSVNFIFNNCKFSLIANSPYFLIENRNFLNRNSFYSFSIFKLKDSSLKNCIKN